ncbi:MAG: 1-deoxy-D-xylulose-5-phosphate synthase [Caldisericaceae bacterium]
MLLESINSPEDLKKLDLNQLNALSDEIRTLIIDTVSKNGGHLASNLGVVDLTIALHYVFDFSVDRILFDVSHQAYAHKILTGRKDNFYTLRQFGGISGYANPEESKYDYFIAGHASTSLALTLGLLKARELKRESYNIITIIGDGALTGGEAYEGLNNLGHLGEKCIIVLNDNGMSISRNVGAISKYLYKLRSSSIYQSFKRILGRNFGKRLKLAIKQLILPSVLFEEFGFTYIGPVDGHNIPELINTLERIKKIDAPILLHVITKKGKGFELSENFPEKYHSAEPFYEVDNTKKDKLEKTFSEVFGETLVELAKNNDKIFAITAAMPDGTKTSLMRESFSTRFLDVGIAEQCAVSTAAALAKEGFKPYVAIYSTFLQRALDQMIHDVGILSLPVVFCVDRAGIVSDDGPTHQGIFDIAFSSIIPNFVISAPKDAFELKGLMELAMISSVPFLIRYPKDVAKDGFSEKFVLKIGTGEKIADGTQLTIITLGPLFYEGLKAYEYLKQKGYSVGLINAIFVKPFDKNLILEAALKSKRVITVEDGIKKGGFGEMIANFLAPFGVITESIAIDDFYPEQGKRSELLKKYGLTSQKIVELGEKLIEKKIG